MTTVKSLVLVLVAATAIASAVQAAPAFVKVLGKKTGTTAGVIAVAHIVTKPSIQPYSAFGFRIRAPEGQMVNAHWSISCFGASRSRMTSGNVNLVGRGAVEVTFWRPPSVSAADTCAMDLIALRGSRHPGLLTAIILGRT
jgi:hypothetical protein